VVRARTAGGERHLDAGGWLVRVVLGFVASGYGERCKLHGRHQREVLSSSRSSDELGNGCSHGLELVGGAVFGRYEHGLNGEGNKRGKEGKGGGAHGVGARGPVGSLVAAATANRRRRHRWPKVDDDLDPALQ
jgi:hypothetical protein